MLSLLTWLCLYVPALPEAPIKHGVVAVMDNVALPARAPAEGIRIEWDRQTISRVSDAQFRSSGYARMIELRDGALLCVYEADGSSFATRSLDVGNTWEKPVPVAWKQTGIHMAVPDVLELQDGSILAMYNPRPWRISGKRNFGIRTRKSYDGGRTWKRGRLVHEAGHRFENGCWEPAAVQMPGGEIRLFFADEGAFRESSEQNISMYRSRDGGLTWTEKPEIICFRPGGRDGMPAPLLLDNGELVLAIEDTRRVGKMKPVIVKPEISDDGTTPVGALSMRRWLALDERLDSSVYAGAPYLRKLSSGETLLSYHSTEGRRNNRLSSAVMRVAIGDKEAREFNRVSEPFPIPGNRWGLWNSVTVLGDDTVVAITSTNAFSRGRSEVWMIKGRVTKELVPEQETIKVDGLKQEEAWAGALLSSIEFCM